MEKTSFLTNRDPVGNSFGWTVIQSLFSKLKSICQRFMTKSSNFLFRFSVTQHKMTKNSKIKRNKFLFIGKIKRNKLIKQNVKSGQNKEQRVNASCPFILPRIHINIVACAIKE